MNLMIDNKNMRVLILIAATALFGFTAGVPDLQQARDRQDRPLLDKLVGEFKGEADKQPNDAVAQYRLALAESYAAEVAVEVKDKAQAKNYAETGIAAAEKATQLKPSVAEYYRILGTLCGQMISSNGLAALRYGNCAMSAVNKALELDPKSAANYLSHGVGYYYLPAALGGGVDVAIKDFQKAIEIDPKSSEAHLWLGIALRKQNKNADAHKALEKAVELNPNRIWAKQQLEKTPAQ
jgi:tetratricopeptide (TPR) repeat protein